MRLKGSRGSRKIEDRRRSRGSCEHWFFTGLQIGNIRSHVLFEAQKGVR